MPTTTQMMNTTPDHEWAKPATAADLASDIMEDAFRLIGLGHAVERLADMFNGDEANHRLFSTLGAEILTHAEAINNRLHNAAMGFDSESAA